MALHGHCSSVILKNSYKQSTWFLFPYWKSVSGYSGNWQLPLSHHVRSHRLVKYSYKYSFFCAVFPSFPLWKTENSNAREYYKRVKQTNKPDEKQANPFAVFQFPVSGCLHLRFCIIILWETSTWIYKFLDEKARHKTIKATCEAMREQIKCDCRSIVLWTTVMD